LHVDGTRAGCWERMAAAGVPRMGAGVDQREDDRKCRRTRRSSTRPRPYAEEIVAGWAVLRLQDLPGAAGVRARQAARPSRSSRSTPFAAARAGAIAGCRRPATSAGSSAARSRRSPTAGSASSTRADAAEATAAALERGRPGERLPARRGRNWTTKEFFARLGRISRTSRRRGLKLARRRGARWGPRGVMGGALPLARQAGRRSTGFSVEMAEHYWWDRLVEGPERELGFAARDPQLTLVDTVAYLRQGVDRRPERRSTRRYRRGDRRGDRTRAASRADRQQVRGPAGDSRHERGPRCQRVHQARTPRGRWACQPGSSYWTSTPVATSNDPSGRSSPPPSSQAIQKPAWPVRSRPLGGRSRGSRWFALTLPVDTA